MKDLAASFRSAPAATGASSLTRGTSTATLPALRTAARTITVALPLALPVAAATRA